MRGPSILGGGDPITSEDFRQLARRRLPKLLFDYIDGAASDEITASENVEAFRRMRLVPRTLRDVSAPSVEFPFLGGSFRMPLMLGPIGSLGLFRVGAEASALRAARQAGIPACLSAFSLLPPEALPNSPGPGDAWQLYVLRDQGRTQAFIDRIAAAGFGTLIVTVDTAVSGIRERDLRNGLRRLTRPSPGMVADFLSHPRWLGELAASRRRGIALADDWPASGSGYLEQAAFLAAQIDPGFDLRGLKRLREQWQGRLVVKGVMHPDDARACVGAGADAIVVSNHGGRQLDGAPPTLEVLPDIVAAVGDRIEVLLDSGVRRGGDIAKSLLLGAAACLLGRPQAFALAAAGETGLAALLSHIEVELDATLALLGKVSSEKPDRSAEPR